MIIINMNTLTTFFIGIAVALVILLCLMYFTKAVPISTAALYLSMVLRSATTSSKDYEHRKYRYLA